MNQVQKDKTALNAEVTHVRKINALLRADIEELVNVELKKSLHSRKTESFHFSSLVFVISSFAGGSA